ncbi:MAG: hypothetical protein NWQ54_14755 [Paraglaciecola sp.]|uniref:hypothetical protein n=1 Tax=Pseudomonadati TaxID=3379134 RepID=UPI00273D2EFE|nr:hypothetical protein [Paraglaciecola sp.]MDP5030794.1 hypothetical protein [Paraglaciecola sp.]MDP5132142.1 hypothetical protein [Paraglaciecola sp.]
MSVLGIIVIISGVLAMSLLVAWLDHAKGWQFSKWINGTVDNPFSPSKASALTKNTLENELTISQLKERIQTLEKIVTEPAYELNKKINNL